MQRLLRSDKFDCIVLDESAAWKKKILRLLDGIRLLNEDDMWYELQVKRLMEDIWIELLVGTETEIVDMEPLPEKEGSRMDTAMQYIYGHYGEDISLESISRAAGISRGECCRMFKKSIQDSPINVLNKYRVEKAAELLETSGKSIADIAGMVGFRSVGAFTAAFKKHMHYAPGEFRKGLREKKK